MGFEVITGHRPDWQKWFARKYQLCQVGKDYLECQSLTTSILLRQWVMGAVPNHPVLAHTIDHIWEQLRTIPGNEPVAIKKYGKRRDEDSFANSCSPPFPSRAVSVTGPAVWTDAILHFLEDEYKVSALPLLHTVVLKFPPPLPPGGAGRRAFHAREHA